VRPQIRELGGGAVLQQVEARFGDFRALREGLLAEDVARAGKVRKAPYRGQKLGLQPFLAVFSQECMGWLASSGLT
jgi:hypothetical protein